jgi:hypothetical protein
MTYLNRRIFLRGLGGAVVAAPFLGSLFERSVKAEVTPAPKRTILMFTHQGCITNNWFPLKLDGELTAEDLQPTTLAPLAPFAKKLLMPRGIRSMNEWTMNNKGAGHGRGQGVDVHIQVVGAALTCQPVTPNKNDPFSFTQSTRFTPMPVGPSLDHVMAQQLSPLGTPMLMNASGQSRESAQTAISYSAASKLYPALNATQAFATLTNLFQPNTPLNEDTWAVAKGKAIADIVKGDLKRLMGQNMSKADKEKLGAWVELANQVGRGLVSVAQCSQDTATRLGASNKLATTSGDALTRKVTETMDNADLYSAIAALSAACNANPVIVLKYPGPFVYSGLGLEKDSYGLAHRLGDGSMSGICVPNVLQMLSKIDGYYAQKFANLVRMLDDISEGDGTLLDNTTAVWLNENSDGCAHNLNNMPIIQAGSGGGYFKTGKIVHLDPGSGATAEDMLGRSLSQCVDDTNNKVDGINQGTGTDPRFGNAPVNKYFCNLMNAMGIKADEHGYPAKDGPNSEVTRYGYSDKTEDFAGGVGAVEGATIHDPGGFTALKA